MKLDREIVDRFLAGQEIADSWVFSEIEEGRRCFDLSDATGREREIRELTQQVSERINVFVPENAEIYRQLFPNFQKELQEVQVCLTVGCPNPYDAMVMQREEDGIRHEVIVFDMARFLGYGERALGLVSRLTTHETAHILMHKRWPVLAEDVPYRRQLQHLCFDEGFAHLLACGEEIVSFDFSGWVDQHWEPSLQKLREMYPLNGEKNYTRDYFKSGIRSHYHIAKQAEIGVSTDSGDGLTFDFHCTGDALYMMSFLLHPAERHRPEREEK